jgi:hypothetical protein
MRFSRIICLALAITFVALWGLKTADGAPVLIKLELSGEGDYQKANQLDLAVYHKLPQTGVGPDVVVAEGESSDLQALSDAGLSWEVIDREPWSESYYLVSESQAAEKIDLAEYGEPLVTVDKSHFMKVSDQNARALAGKGYYIVKVSRHRLPLKYKPQRVSVPRSSARLPDIDSLLSLISVDSLYQWTLRMQNFRTRYSYTDSVLAARDWLRDKFAGFGIDSLWLNHFDEDSDQWNVVATVVGTSKPDKVIVVGGHYDSVVYGTGADPYSWAPGADDNATGTVAALEMARIVAQHPLPVTVIFVPFAQEEQGLIGSYWFCHWLYYHYVDVHVMINCDMIAHSVDSYQDMEIYAASSAMDFVTTLMNMTDIYTYLTPSYVGQSSGSDHYSFYQWGYDAVFAAEGDFFYGGWHKNYDIVDSLDFDYMTEVVKACLATAVTVARDIGYLPGDPNWDSLIDVADALYILNYLYKNGPAPDPIATGDVTCDEIVDLEDAIFLLNYLFKGGPAPPPSC